MTYKGAHYLLIVEHDGPPMVFKASDKAVTNSMIRTGGKRNTIIRNIFSVRFSVAKYKCTTNKLDMSKFRNLDMLDTAIETGHASCAEFSYTLTYHKED